MPRAYFTTAVRFTSAALSTMPSLTENPTAKSSRSAGVHIITTYGLAL